MKSWHSVGRIECFCWRSCLPPNPYSPSNQPRMVMARASCFRSSQKHLATSGCWNLWPGLRQTNSCGRLPLHWKCNAAASSTPRGSPRPISLHYVTNWLPISESYIARMARIGEQQETKIQMIYGDCGPNERSDCSLSPPRRRFRRAT
jgi:hypothetical protein